jgi:YgiT-type zinc finger domain-containing protein
MPCSECSVGLMHPARVAYFTWLGNELITVPDFPAWVCDICGKREYDAQALRQLTQLLSPAGARQADSRPTRLEHKPARKPKGARPAAGD